MRATATAASMSLISHEQLSTHSHGLNDNEGVCYPEEDSDEGWMSILELAKLYLLTPSQDAVTLSSGDEDGDTDVQSELALRITPSMQKRKYSPSP